MFYVVRPVYRIYLDIHLEIHLNIRLDLYLTLRTPHLTSPLHRSTPPNSQIAP